MKYELKIDDVVLNEKNVENIKISLLKNIKDSFVNNKSRMQIEVTGNIYTLDNINNKIENTIKKLIDLKEKYIDVTLFFENVKYEIKKMYIHSLIQNFNNGASTFNLIMYQKNIISEKEMILIENIDK